MRTRSILCVPHDSTSRPCIEHKRTQAPAANYFAFFDPYRDKRDEFSRAPQSAAGQAGLQTTHSIRRKTLRRTWQGVRKRAPEFHCRADDFLLQRDCVLLHLVRKRVGSSHPKPASINPYAELRVTRGAVCYVLSSAGHDPLAPGMVFGGNVCGGPCRQCWLMQENCDASHQVPQTDISLNTGMETSPGRLAFKWANHAQAP